MILSAAGADGLSACSASVLAALAITIRTAPLPVLHESIHSTDIEGTAGIVDWQQVRGPGAEYESGRQLLTDEVNAAIEGAVDAGASHKRSITRFAAESLHPNRACELIRAGAVRALARAKSLWPPAIDLPATIEITFLTSDMAEMSTWIRGVERTAAKVVTVTDDDPLRLYRTFVTVVSLTRSIVER